MTIQLSVAVRNARLDAIETAIGASAVLRMFTGAPPANVATANSGTEIATMNFPSDYFANAASGQKAKSGTWQDLLANNAGTLGHFRIYASDGTTCHLQGTITATGGGGDMEVNNTVVAANQQIDVTTFTLNEPNS